MESLRERLRRGDVLPADGAWGTMLMERGFRLGQCPEAFNLERPEVITEIAGLYLDAGAEIITTNTFGGSALKLAQFGLEAKTEEINRRGVELALGAARGRAYVSASVGPSGKILKPYGDTEAEALRTSFERQIGALVAAGADMVCVETMTDLAEAVSAVEAARSLSLDIPILATMTFDATPRGLFTIMGVSVERAAAGLLQAGADIVGSNCGNGIETMVQIAREFRKCTDKPLAIQANAGLPQRREGRVVYPETPEFMAARIPELLEIGVSIIGGCCGTSPEHVRAFREALNR